MVHALDPADRAHLKTLQPQDIAPVMEDISGWDINPASGAYGRCLRELTVEQHIKLLEELIEEKSGETNTA